METGERYELELYCPRCGRQTPHLVGPRAAGRSQVTCVVCGRGSVEDTLQFMEHYMGSFVRRLVVKPFQLGEEAMHDPRRFLATLPGRVVTKPFRVAAELRTTLDIVRGGGSRGRRAERSREARPFSPTRRAFRLLLSAPLLWAHDTLDILQRSKELGYDGVELWAFSLVQEGTDLQTVRRRAQELGLAVTLHALSWDLNPTSRLEAIRNASVAELHRSVDLAAEVGAELVALHPGRVTVPYDDGVAYRDTLIGVLRELADHASEHGLRLGLEHMEARQGEYMVDAGQVTALVRAVDRPNLGITLDVAHIPWGEDEAAFVQRLEPLVHVHFSDADETRLHLPLGQGKRDLQACLRCLSEFTGCVVLEGFSMSVGDELARWNKGRFEELWQEIASTPGQSPAAHTRRGGE